jgi:chromosome segregation ATPase
MATLDSRSAPTSRIESAVERELARRRRLLRLYLLLLLIPLGIAAWFLVVGRSDHEIFRQTVEQRVAPVEERYQQIAPRLAQVETLDRALPVVEKAAEQLQAQERQVATLEQQVREITPVVEEIQVKQASLLRVMESPPAEVRELTSRLAAVERNLAGVQRLSTQLVEQEQRLAVMERQQRQVVLDLKEVEDKVRRQPGPIPGFNGMELQKLNERVRSLEQGTGDLRKEFSRLQVDVRERRPPG